MLKNGFLFLTVEEIAQAEIEHHADQLRQGAEVVKVSPKTK